MAMEKNIHFCKIMNSIEYFLEVYKKRVLVLTTTTNKSWIFENVNDLDFSKSKPKSKPNPKAQ